MLYFIQHRDLLMAQYEYDGGFLPNEKVNAKRWKQVKTGEATIVRDREIPYGDAKPIVRKGRN